MKMVWRAILVDKELINTVEAVEANRLQDTSIEKAWKRIKQDILDYGESN